MLRMHGVTAHYGASQVLFGMELTLEQGQLVTLLGRNGMGKTTTVRAIMGMVAVAAGRISLDGTELIGLPTHVIAQAGIGLVPEGRQIFPNLTARENLIATAANRRGRATPWTLERVLDLFPGLAARAGHLGSALSGGEQQMLAIGRALMTNPKVLLLDEATEGLAPLVRSEIWAVLESLKREGESILLIDKNLQSLLRLADRHYVMERGRTVWCGSSTELAGRRDLQMRYLGV